MSLRLKQLARKKLEVDERKKMKFVVSVTLISYKLQYIDSSKPH